jgi:hypothetical protein
MVMAVLAPAISSCKKEKPTIAIITVNDQTGAPAYNAHVKLFANPPLPTGDQTRLNKEGYTDGSGRVSFDYSEFYEKGQSGFAVLDILATKDGITGRGIIKITEEVTNEEIVVLGQP